MYSSITILKHNYPQTHTKMFYTQIPFSALLYFGDYPQGVRNVKPEGGKKIDTGTKHLPILRIQNSGRSRLKSPNFSFCEITLFKFENVCAQKKY